ncbi:MAG: TetR/AcrR family transcriptional regulator [Chloroflexi bacterium]|nr:TetR/AcrR family transcriptional regulator [Chloroflexota bacterium]
MPKPDVTEERTAQIIAAAVNAFARLGFAKTRMDDIATESGLSKGTLYLYFKSKDEIITAVLNQFFTEELDGIADLLAAPLSAAEKMETLIVQMMADTEVQLGQYLSVWLEFYSVAAREGPLRDIMLQYMTQLIDLFTTLIQEGIDNGEFRAVINARDSALTISAQFEGLLLLWAIDRESLNLAVATTTAVDLLLRGLRMN